MHDGHDSRGQGDAADAAHAFGRARRAATLRRFLARMSGHAATAASYDEVRRRLRAVESAERSLEDVPIAAIVGSVGRANDFTREFLPLKDTDRERWTRVRRMMTGLEGVPPVELYRIGDAYFVKDGNHRVSVARELGAPTIQAYVTPVRTSVPYGPDVDPADLIVRSEQATFLEATGLDRLRPGLDLRLTEPGGYERLREHISVHRWLMGVERKQPIGEEEAILHWADEVYGPVARAIRESGVLRSFPQRTEADLYLWLADHRADLQRRLGWEIPPEQVAVGMARDRFRDAGAREEALRESAPTPAGGSGRALVDDVLVVLAGPEGEPVLEREDDPLPQALRIARLEGARLYALAPAGANEADRDRFQAACREEGVAGQWAQARSEDLGQEVIERARWVDLVVARLRRGEGVTPWARPVLRRSPRPWLAVDGPVSGLARPLLAYDGSERADIALVAAAYLALRHGARPHTVYVHTGAVSDASKEVLARAERAFARYGVTVAASERSGGVAENLLAAADELGADAIVMGSHGRARWWEEVFGGVVEPVVGGASRPVLIV